MSSCFPCHLDVVHVLTEQSVFLSQQLKSTMCKFCKSTKNKIDEIKIQTCFYKTPVKQAKMNFLELTIGILVQWISEPVAGKSESGLVTIVFDRILVFDSYQ